VADPRNLGAERPVVPVVERLVRGEKQQEELDESEHRGNECPTEQQVENSLQVLP
jgi:hypothetical protein